jgi:rubrerythrin
MISDCAKIKYNNPQQAAATLKRCRKRRRGHRKEIRIYRCPECGYYHLTSQKTYKRCALRKGH